MGRHVLYCYLYLQRWKAHKYRIIADNNAPLENMEQLF